MLGCLRTTGLGGWGGGVGEVEGVGWLSVPWGAEGVRKKTGGRAAPLSPPIQYSLALIKRAQSWGGVDVDYKGGGICKRVLTPGFVGEEGELGRLLFFSFALIVIFVVVVVVVVLWVSLSLLTFASFCFWGQRGIECHEVCLEWRDAELSS